MIIVDSYKYKKRFLLDRFPAVVAYSLRQLKAGVTNVVRVRRSGDNTEQDFTATQITDGTLEAFCGAGNGFVTTWYDQSGNGYNVTQTIQASQPQIVVSGALITDNGEPALDWGTAINSKGLFNLAVNISHKSSFSVINYDGPNPFTGFNGILTYNNATNNDLPILTASSGTGWYAGLQHRHNGGVPTTTALPTIENQTLVFDAIVTTSNRNQIYIGIDRGFSNRSWRGKIQELIIYNTDQTANRTAIETDINNYYSIYLP